MIMNWMDVCPGVAWLHIGAHHFGNSGGLTTLLFKLITDRIMDKLMFTQEPVSPLLAHSLLYFFPSLQDLDKFVAAASSPGPGVEEEDALLLWPGW